MTAPLAPQEMVWPLYHGQSYEALTVYMQKKATVIQNFCGTKHSIYKDAIRISVWGRKMWGGLTSMLCDSFPVLMSCSPPSKTIPNPSVLLYDSYMDFSYQTLQKQASVTYGWLIWEVDRPNQPSRTQARCHKRKPELHQQLHHDDIVPSSTQLTS